MMRKSVDKNFSNPLLLLFSQSTSQGLVVLPVLLSLVGPSPHDASIVMEDFYRADDSSEEGDTNKGPSVNDVRIEGGGEQAQIRHCKIDV